MKKRYVKQVRNVFVAWAKRIGNCFKAAEHRFEKTKINKEILLIHLQGISMALFIVLILKWLK